MPERSPAKIIVIAITFFGLVFSPTFASAAENGARLAGRIVSAGADTPREVLLVDTAGTHLYRGPIDDAGRFEIDGLPSASYRLAVQSDDGAFVGSAPVQLEAGETHVIQLALARAAPDKKDKKKKKGKDDEDDDLEDEDEEESRKKLLAGLGPWNNPGLATAFVIGGAFLVGWGIEKTTDDSTPVASASMP